MTKLNILNTSIHIYSFDVHLRSCDHMYSICGECRLSYIKLLFGIIWLG